MKQYSIEVATQASQMLEEHVEFLGQSSLSAAAKTKKDIISAIVTPSSMPERHPYLDDEALPKNRYRKFLTCDRYFILYQIKDDTVYVDYIVDCRQDPSWLHL